MQMVMVNLTKEVFVKIIENKSTNALEDGCDFVMFISLANYSNDASLLFYRPYFCLFHFLLEFLLYFLVLLLFPPLRKFFCGFVFPLILPPNFFSFHILFPSPVSPCSYSYFSFLLSFFSLCYLAQFAKLSFSTPPLPTLPSFFFPPAVALTCSCRRRKLKSRWFSKYIGTESARVLVFIIFHLAASLSLSCWLVPDPLRQSSPPTRCPLHDASANLVFRDGSTGGGYPFPQ